MKGKNIKTMNIKIKIYGIFLSLLFFAGCANNCDNNLSEKTKKRFKEIEPICEQYIEKNIAFTGYNGKAFCSCDLLGIEDNKIYLWVYCEEYYLKDSVLEKGSGLFQPVVLEFYEDEIEFQITRHYAPTEGIGWEKSIKEIFPKCIYQNEILIENQEEFQKKYDERGERLGKRNMERAKEYYKTTGILGVWILNKKDSFDTDTLLITLINNKQLHIEPLRDATENTQSFSNVVFKGNELTYNTFKNDTIKYYQFQMLENKKIFTGGTLDSWKGKKERIILTKINQPI